MKDKRKIFNFIKQTKLKQRFVVLFLIFGLIPIITSSITQYQLSSKHITDEWSEFLNTLADQKAEQISTWFTYREMEMELFVHDPFIINATTSVLHNGYNENNPTDIKLKNFIASILDLYQSFNQIFFINSEGEIIFTQEKNITATQKYESPFELNDDVSTQDFFIYPNAIANRTHEYRYLSPERIIDPETNEVGILIACPFHNISYMNLTENLGIVVGLLNIDILFQMLTKSFELGDSGEIYLVNDELQWVTPPKFSQYYLNNNDYAYENINEILLQETVPQLGIQQAFEEKTTIIKENTDYRGKLVLGVYKYMNIYSLQGHALVMVAEIDRDEAFNAINQEFLTTILLISIFSILIVVAAWFIGQSLANPMIEMNKFVKKISKNDLTGSLTIENKYETGELAEGLRKMQSNLITRTSKNMLLADQLSSSAEELAASAEEVSSSSENIASSQQRISKGATEQVLAINDIQVMFSALTNGIRSIRDQIKEINTISDVIRHISDQTNMLALNAAIEAARAGDAGRGFKVVADHVRKLADESRKAVETTDKMLGEIQKITEVQEKDAVSIMNAVDSIAETTEDASSNTEETAAAAEEQASSMTMITDTATHLLTIAEELNLEFKNYKIIKENQVSWDKEALFENEEDKTHNIPKINSENKRNDNDNAF